MNMEKQRRLEAIFEKYGAVQTELDQFSGEGKVYAMDDSYYRAGTAIFEGKEFLLISCIDQEKYAALGIMEDIDVLPIDTPEERLDKAVRYAFGIEPYPEKYPEE